MDAVNIFQEIDFNVDTMYTASMLPEAPYLSMDYPMDQFPQPLKRSRPRASLACIPCRSRHLKCDAKPVCSRCELDQRPCSYTRSRRGGKRRVNHQHPTPDSATSSQSSSGRIEISEILTPNNDHSANLVSLYYNDIDVQPETASPTRQEKLLDLYYEKFHDAHPIILPRNELYYRLQRDPESLRHLIPVMEYIGSIYHANGSSDALRRVAHNTVTDNPLPQNGFSVQALLLFAISIHCSDEYEAGDAMIDLAMDIALSIGMFHKPFAQDNGEDGAILAESWRRTAWGLFLIDVLFAAIAHRSTHRLQTFEIDVDLPCEDQEYETGSIMQPRTLIDYQNREFDEEAIIFSSFAYFIDAGRILSSAMADAQEIRGPGDHALNAADARLVTWFLYLPKCKREIMKDNGEVDEIMFLAHLWINTEKLLIHRPKSKLQYSGIECASKCTPHIYSQTAQKSIIFHTSKTLEAIEAAFKLFTFPCSYLKHTPMVTCSLALFIMSQVSACTHVLRKGSSTYMAGRERVRMGLGVLRTHQQYWGLAKRSVDEVRGIARQLLTVNIALESADSATDMGSMEPSQSVGKVLNSFAVVMDTDELFHGQRSEFAFHDMCMPTY